MIFRRLGLLHKNQVGFTLIEMLVSVAVTGIISVGASMTTVQMIRVNTSNNIHMTAITQLESAYHWISRDAQMAQVLEPTGVSGFPLNLTWVDWDNNANQVIYTMEGSALKRSYSLNGGEANELVVAQNINPDAGMTNCDFTSGVLTLEMTATVGDGSQIANETRIFEIIPRPD